MHPLVELRSMQDLISPQCVPNVVIALGGHPKHVMHPCSTRDDQLIGTENSEKIKARVGDVLVDRRLRSGHTLTIMTMRW